MKVVHFIFNNSLYKLVAIVVAVVLWSATQGFRSVSESVDVAVTFEDQPKDLVVVRQSAREINFKIVGSRWAVRRARQELGAYPISLARAKPGDLQVEVNPRRFSPLLRRGAEISAHSPSVVSIRLDTLFEKPVRVRAETSGELPRGLRLEGIEVEPATIRLQGARSVLTPMREVTTEVIDLATLRQTTPKEVPVVIGSANVWAAEGVDTTVRVLLRIVPALPAPPGVTGSTSGAD